MRRIPLTQVIAGLAMLVFFAGTTVFIACGKKDAASQTKTTVYHCPMHPNYLSHEPGSCPICGMNLVPANEGDDNGTGVKIDPAMIQSIGVQTEKAAIRTLTGEVRATATVMPDERRISSITTKVMGYIQKLHVNYTGQPVKIGQPLYDLYSPDLVSAQSEYLQTYRGAALKDSGLLQSARQRLLNWDVTQEQIAALEKTGIPEKTMTIVSPAQGVVTEKMIVEGQNIEPGMQLYKIVNYSRVWVEGAIYQQDVPLVKLGQRADIELDYYPGERFSGAITYISPELNMESRTLMVRIELGNTPDIRIKPGMNASISIHAKMHENSITIPDQAVIRSGLRTLAVVAKGGGYFEPREIKTGRTAGGYTEVIGGIAEGEDIVVSSQFLIDSESNLKAAVMKLNNGEKIKGESPLPDTVTLGAGNAQKTMVKQVYTCPMHPEVIDDKPGKCPKCGMNLVLQKK